MFIAKFNRGFLCLCFLFVKALCKVGQPCNYTSVIEEPCPTNELCDESQTCQCETNYDNVDGSCVSQTITSNTYSNYSSMVDNHGDGSLVAGILIPLFLIALVICSIYISKRFELVKWLRERFSQRNRNYDEFMIGQDDDDDPPLA